MKTCRVGVRISEEARERVEKSGVSISEYIRNLIENVEHKENNVEQKISNVEHNVEHEETVIDATLKDTLRMISLSVGGKEEDVAAFLKDLHDKLESGEYQIVNGKLKLGYHEVFEVLNRAEVKKALRAVWDACDEKGRPYTDGMRAVFLKGAEKAVESLYNDRQ